MPKNFIVTLKKDSPADAKQKMKDDIVAQGGKIGHDYTLINGFSAELPDDHVSTLESHPHVENMEPDSEMKTQ